MAAFSVARRQPRAVDRRTQQRFTGALPILVEIIKRSIGVLEAVIGPLFSAQDQGAIKNIAIAYGTTRERLVALENKLERIARLQVALKIDIPAIHADQIGQHGAGQTGSYTRVIEA